ncbi:DegT/DnrJ/EryC1/StrS family aminotransferase [Halapricum hydrolyticum]|uniref:DegT/DnrJ/EryC1/StrS family aminotransferase n=1 Tax=Halapricum hydrolyticum TaxID=2979991 RepID=A0AAE3LFJ3_9EURY|nr:DegT/DnrJ/EryC1/StrS family aminotransferase [Halapricum hydrolyticum]MCU4718621.1 DegT/DnrJ/EryC1/StrS family aminotransferase [Halapricum hydrolyticum]MCU4727530.1 DegT/DnrJ/EryC1/StrS family aminotransferase [Halapricum hydrolyticum]
MISLAAPDIGEPEFESVEDVIKEGRLVAGEEVEQFEAAFAEYVGAEHGVATVNGTAALHTALEALDIGEGDTVVTTPFSFIATANAIRFANAEPVFADIDPKTLNLDPDSAEAAVREHDADAILVVHLYGQPARMERFREIADAHDLALIEDAAQAHGATIDGEHVGTIGDAGCFSFYPTKNMTTGEGGIVVTDDEAVARRADQFINHGRTGSYTHATLGHNYRMTNIAGAIGLTQLQKLPYYVDQRRRNAQRLLEELDDDRLELPEPRPGTEHAYHQFTVQYPQRNALKLDLEERDIGTGVYYPTTIHRQGAYAGEEAATPVAERATDQVLSLPVHPGLTDEDITTIVEAVERHLTRAWEAIGE